jgi:aminoglycoside phosphotransferase (APT) family kinase protein
MNQPSDFPEAAELASSLAAMGLIAEDEAFAIERLPGGVSCDVWRIAPRGGGDFIVKRALAKLRVSADWFAPAERSHTEVEWFRLVAQIDAALVPRVLGEDRARHLFAMDYLPPDTHPLWKAQLAAGIADAALAAAVGAALARIHAATAGRADIAAQFANDAQFFALRLEPYLLYTVDRHPDVAAPIRALARGIAAARIALMQGDISPKNILRGACGPVFLDAETASYGDPAFDLAFCLNHLLLKGVWHPEFADGYLACFGALAEAYLRGVVWEAPSEIETRTATLLPALLLARVDGKSPVEYLTDERDKALVRTFAKRQLLAPAPSLDALRLAWRNSLRE